MKNTVAGRVFFWLTLRFFPQKCLNKMGRIRNSSGSTTVGRGVSVTMDLNISWASSICSLVRERWLRLCPCWACTGAAMDWTTGCNRKQFILKITHLNSIILLTEDCDHMWLFSHQKNVKIQCCRSGSVPTQIFCRILISLNLLSSFLFVCVCV